MSSRASSRLKERIAIRPSVDPPRNTVTQTSTSRPKKKQKSKAAFNTSPATDSTRATNHVRTRSRKGKLRIMTEMPMEILFEIFGQLEPVDLLYLSRATKGLRSILTAPNATFLWKMAYQNLSHPPPICPPGVNLRHYTNFLYSRNCHFCASVYGIYLHYTARVRFCRVCATKCFKSFDDSFVDGALETKALHLCSYSYISKRILPCRVMTAYVLKIEYDQKVRALQEIGDDNVALNVFLREQNDLQSNRHRHGGMIRIWWVRHKAEHSAKLAELRSRRRNEIAQRIHAEGYGSELDSFPIWRLPGVKSTKELSDQNWERIKPRLIEVLECKRQENSKRKMINEFTYRIQQLSRIVTEFHSNIPEPFIVPPTVHFAKTTPFVDLIKNTSVSQKVADSEIRDLTPYIHGITASWRESADKLLLDLLPRKSTSRSRKGKGKEISTSRLELATTFFKCHWCREPISYPLILMHKCLRRGQLDESEERIETKDGGNDEDVNTDEEDEEDDKDEDRGKYRPEQKKPYQGVDVNSVWSQMSSWYGTEWNEDDNQVTFDNETAGFAEAIIKACGEDPGEVTFDQMSKINRRVECLRCSKKYRGRKRLVMNWTTAILHDIDKHFEEAPDQKGWLLIGEEDAAT